MRNYHVSLGNQDAAAWVQFQFLDEGQIVQAGPRYGTAVDLHGIEQGNRSDLTGTARCPLNGTEDGFHHIVLKLKGDTVLVVMACAPQRLGIGNAVIAQHDPVNGQLLDVCNGPQMLDFALHLYRRCFLLYPYEGTDFKAKRFQILQKPPTAILVAAKGIHAFNDVESIEVDMAILTDGWIKQPDRASSQIPGIFDVSVLGILHLFKVIRMDQTLACDNKPLFIGDFQRHVAERRNVVGDILANLTIPSCGCLRQLAVFIDQLDRQAIQLQHEQNRTHSSH